MMGSVVLMVAISGRANIRQVAALAGVSHQTVSRAFDGDASIRPATRERVLAAIEELVYRPNHAARGEAIPNLLVAQLVDHLDLTGLRVPPLPGRRTASSIEALGAKRPSRFKATSVGTGVL